MSGVKRNLTIKCPYCNFENRVWIEITGNTNESLDSFYCNIEEGGCDKKILLITQEEIKIKHLALKMPEPK